MPSEIILNMLSGLPWYGDLFLVMGTLRAIFKPVATVISLVVKATPSLEDDKALSKFRSSKAYALAAWAVDYFASVKI